MQSLLFLVPETRPAHSYHTQFHGEPWLGGEKKNPISITVIGSERACDTSQANKAQGEVS